MGNKSTKAKLDLFKRYHAECASIFAEWQARDNSHPPARYPEFPEELRGLQCGARTRAGTPCKLTAIYSSGRCKFHGGMSTGPRTTEGKERAAENGRKGGRPKAKPVEGRENTTLRTIGAKVAKGAVATVTRAGELAVFGA